MKTATKNIDVKLTDQAIQNYKNGKPLDALLQIIWNAIDAEATEIDITLDRSQEAALPMEDEVDVPLGKIIIKDNGVGINFDKVDEYFSQYKSSWKMDAKRKDGRDYHGKNGVGRFRYLALGENISWLTTHEKGDAVFQYEMNLSYQNPRNIQIENEHVTSKATGTAVTISNLNPKAATISENEVISTILQGVGLYIKSNLGKFSIVLNGKAITPDDYIEKEESGLFEIEDDEGKHTFKYQFIAWDKDFKFTHHKHTFIYDNDENYKDYFASGAQASNYLPFHTVFVFSDYYRNYDEYNECFKKIAGQIKRKYKEKLTKFLFKVKKKRSKKEFEAFKLNDFYPFTEDISNDVTKAERSLFDLCAFSLLEHDPKIISDKKHSLKLLFKLLKKFVEEDENIADNLSELLELDDTHARQLKSVCKSTKLPLLISHYSELQRREAFLDVLDMLVHDDFYIKNLKERTQLHKIVEKELWVFGDEFDYNLGTSDQRLTEVLSKFLENQDLNDSEIQKIKDDIDAKKDDLENCLKKIPDLYLWRQFNTTQEKRTKNIIIELKAPKVKLSSSLLDQGEKVYTGVISAAGVDISEKNQWLYIYVSSEITDSLRNKFQGDAERQVISEYKNGNYVISCLTWGQIIQEARFKLADVKKNLEIKISAEQKQDLLNKYLDAVNFDGGVK